MLRTEIKKIMNNFENIVVTGASGAIGKAFINNLSKYQGVNKTIKIKRLEHCETCSGSGAKQGTMPVSCSQCNGAGQVRQVSQSFFGQSVSVRECPVCSGSGQTIQNPCNSCGGSGLHRKTVEIKIKVPSGVSAGNYMTLNQQGNKGPKGYQSGDLIIFFEEEEQEGFGGEMWNGVFYPPGQEAALNQARIDFPNGWMNGGQGENFGGGGSMVHMAQPGPQMLQGSSNVQDTFVFNLSEANGFGSGYNPVTLMGNAMSGDEIRDFDPADGDKIKNIIHIAGALKHSSQNIAFHEVGRQAIMNDNNWNKGSYNENGKRPETGLAVARMIAHITYLSENAMHRKFGRKLQSRDIISFGFDADFQVESYLRYQGRSFVERFDANSYLYLTRAMDYFDIVDKFSKAIEFPTISNKHINYLVISFTSDWLFPTIENKEIVKKLNYFNRNVSFTEIETDKGHDSFLLDELELDFTINGFLESNYRKLESHE